MKNLILIPLFLLTITTYSQYNIKENQIISKSILMVDNKIPTLINVETCISYLPYSKTLVIISDGIETLEFYVPDKINNDTPNPFIIENHLTYKMIKIDSNNQLSNIMPFLVIKDNSIVLIFPETGLTLDYKELSIK